MNKTYLAGIACIVCLCLTGIARAESQIGFVEMNQVIQQSTAGASAMKNLAAFKEVKQKSLAAKEKNIQELKAQINQKIALNAKDAGLTKLQKDYQSAVQAYNKLQAENEAEIQKKDRELTRDILEDVYLICNELKTVKRLSYIFDKGQSGIIVFPPENDLTQEVIKRYDARYKGKGK